MNPLPISRIFKISLGYTPDDYCLLPNARLGDHMGAEASTRTACKFHVLTLEWLCLNIRFVLIRVLGYQLPKDQIPHEFHDDSD